MNDKWTAESTLVDFCRSCAGGNPQAQQRTGGLGSQLGGMGLPNCGMPTKPATGLGGSGLGYIACARQPQTGCNGATVRCDSWAAGFPMVQCDPVAVDAGDKSASAAEPVRRTSQPAAPGQGQGAYTIADLARRCGVSEKAAWKWHQSRRLPGLIRCGRAVRYDRQTIERRLLGGELLLPVDGR